MRFRAVRSAVMAAAPLPVRSADLDSSQVNDPKVAGANKAHSLGGTTPRPSLQAYECFVVITL